jgi:hypothetical protein
MKRWKISCAASMLTGAENLVEGRNLSAVFVGVEDAVPQ